MGTDSKTPAPSTRLGKHFLLSEIERKFRRACEQIILLDFKVNDLQARYNRSRAANRRNFRYTHRLQLAVAEGVLNVYNEYAHVLAERMIELRRELYGESDDEDDDTDDDSSDDEEAPF